MKIGFTGTRKGMTEAQLHTFMELFQKSPHANPEDFHHGMAIGSDEDAVVIVHDQTDRSTVIIAHPCNLHESQQSQKARGLSTVVHTEEPPLKRNCDIVDAVEKIIACPGGMVEEQRSGTWATIRYTRKQRNKLVIIWPDGTTTEERA